MKDTDDTTLTGPPATALRRALRVLGDPWTMLILKDAFGGVRRFSDFQRSLAIPKQTLSLRLAHLCEAQMLYKRFTAPNAGTAEYAPTLKTFDLQEAMYSVWLWHRANPAEVDALPFDLVHRDCGQVLGASFRCTACTGPVDNTTVTITPTDPPQIETEPRPRLARRNDMAVVAGQSAQPGQRAMVAASLVGDIPCNEILYQLFRGPRHFLGLARDLQLGPPLLRDRLDKLADLGLVRQTQEGRRAVFSLLPRAAGVYPLLISLAAWGDRWCNMSDPPPEVFVHDCGQILKARFMCDHCGIWINRRNIRVVAHDPEIA